MLTAHRSAAFQLVRKLVKTERRNRELLLDRDVFLNRRELSEVSGPFAVELSGVHIQSRRESYIGLFGQHMLEPLGSR